MRKRTFWIFLASLAVMTFGAVQVWDLMFGLRRGDVSVMETAVGITGIPFFLGGTALTLRVLFVTSRRHGRDTGARTMPAPPSGAFLLLLAAGLALATLLATPGGLLSAHGESITVEPLAAKPGQSINVSGNGFEAGATVEIELAGTRGVVMLGEAVADAGGAFAVKFEIPGSAVPGTYQLKAVGPDETLSVDFSVEDDAAAGSGAQGESAMGSGPAVVYQRGAGEIWAITAIAVVLGVAGAVLVLAGTESGLRFWRRTPPRAH